MFGEDIAAKKFRTLPHQSEKNVFSIWADQRYVSKVND